MKGGREQSSRSALIVHVQPRVTISLLLIGSSTIITLLQGAGYLVEQPPSSARGLLIEETTNENRLNKMLFFGEKLRENWSLHN